MAVPEINPSSLPIRLTTQVTSSAPVVRRCRVTSPRAPPGPIHGRRASFSPGPALEFERHRWRDGPVCNAVSRPVFAVHRSRSLRHPQFDVFRRVKAVAARIWLREEEPLARQRALVTQRQQALLHSVSTFRRVSLASGPQRERPQLHIPRITFRPRGQLWSMDTERGIPDCTLILWGPRFPLRVAGIVRTFQPSFGATCLPGFRTAGLICFRHKSG